MQSTSPLPKVPLPSLKNTLSGYLATIKPLIPGAEFRRQQRSIERFGGRRGHGQRIQRRLQEIAEEEDNWVNKFWIEDMYLKARAPLPINSSPAMVFPEQHFFDEDDWLRFSSRLVGAAIDYKLLIDMNKLKVEIVSYPTVGQPLCMDQYRQLFCNCRRPVVGCDALVLGQAKEADGDEPRTDVVLVICLNQMFLVDVSSSYKLGRETTDEDIFQQLKHIVDFARTRKVATESGVGILTSDERNRWAEFRLLLMRDKVNCENIDDIERSAFALCLDATLPRCRDTSDLSSLSSLIASRDNSPTAHRILHGSGSSLYSSNRWFDKTLQFIVGQDGTCGLCYEHSPAEGIAVVKLAEYTLTYITNSRLRNSPQCWARSSFTPSRAKMTSSSTSRETPRRLVWKVTPDVRLQIDRASLATDRMILDLDVDVLRFNGFGREFPKAHNISVDAFIQVALQLTYYKIHRQPVATYESASIRRFRFGRVDNIRSCTSEVLEWCRAMVDRSNDHATPQLFQLLRRAVRRQTELQVKAVSGYGIDNHLLAIRQVALQLGYETPTMFSDDVYALANRFLLSTSQILTSTDTFMLYGPVVAEGYGVSYNPQSERIIVCVSSFKSCTDTDSRRFSATMVATLNEIRELCITTDDPTKPAVTCCHPFIATSILENISADI